MSKFPFDGDGLLGWGNQAIEFLIRNRMSSVFAFSAAIGVVLFATVPPAKDVEASAENKSSSIELSAATLKSESVFFFESEEIQGCTPEKVVHGKNMFELKENEFEKELYAMVGDHPIKEMVPYIAKKDRKVAGFLVGIAKKESNWGKRVPTQDGQDCFNYWGYKGAGEKGSAMGYACFASTKEAIDVVGGRLDKLVAKKLDTPGKMIVWKCGSSCAGHDPQGVTKWISDVSLYFNKISNKKV